MRTFLLGLGVVAVAMAGCLGTAPAAPDPPAPAAAAPGAGAPEPVTVAWNGHALVSQGEGWAHMAATEPLVAPLYAEGFLFEVTEVPQRLWVALAWEGQGEQMIMIHAPHGKAGYREYVTAMSSEKVQCLEVPAGDLAPGKWQVMTHTSGAANNRFTLEVTTVGGAGAILPGEPHGHAMDEEFDIEERPVLPCTG